MELQTDPKAFFSFTSFNEHDYSSFGMMKLSSEDNDRPIDINTINSSLVRFLLLLKDTISFH